MTDAEKRKLREILGFGPELVNNEGWRQIYYNPVWDLEGIIRYLERKDIDKNCIQTLKKLQQQLIDFDNYVR
jgi:hypothetical protein